MADNLDKILSAGAKALVHGGENALMDLLGNVDTDVLKQAYQKARQATEGDMEAVGPLMSRVGAQRAAAYIVSTILIHLEGIIEMIEEDDLESGIDPYTQYDDDVSDDRAFDGEDSL